MWRPSQDLERDPRRQPSPASILRAVEFRSCGVTVIAANHWRPLMLEDELEWISMDLCKRWIYLLCCLCELLWFESSHKFPRTLFSRILVWKRILAFSYPRWVDDRAAFTLHTRVSAKAEILSPKQESKVVSTPCYHIHSRVQTHVVTAPQRMMSSGFMPSPMQAVIDSTVTNYLPEKQINLWNCA